MAPLSPVRRCLLLVAALIALLLAGAVLANFSMAAHPRFPHLPWSVDSQEAIRERRIFVFEGIAVDYPSWRNRIAVPYAMHATQALLPVSASQAYILIRWATACAALAAFAWLVRVATRAPLPWCGLGAFCFALCLFPTFLHLYEIPSDFLDAASFSVLVGCALLRRRGWFAVLLLVSLLNRESAIFAVPVWWALHAWPFARRAFLRETAFSAALGLAGTAVVIALRQGNALPGSTVRTGLQPFGPLDLLQVHLGQIREFVLYFNYGNPLFFLAGYLLFAALVAAACWSRLTPPLRRLGLAGAGLYGVSVIYGNLGELRISIPSLVISTLLLLWLAFPTPAATASS